MKKLYLLMILNLLLACSDGGAKKHYASTNKKKFYKIASKYKNRVRPSESMQIGLAKPQKNYKLKNEDYSENSNYAEKKYLYQTTDGADAQEFDAVDKEEMQQLFDDKGNYIGYFKVGNPYEVFGVNYIPQDYDDYEEVGTASWYGDDFHGKLTANGEVYNMGSMTAAHPTLPLPSLVRVTNLRNGKSVIVRVNDRGPFAKNRVIDVSEKAAILLGFRDYGTTEVKIELLRSDTDQLLEKLKINGLQK
jgi:rare lipoprotein A (peptidoglycan hydrolase)